MPEKKTRSKATEKPGLGARLHAWVCGPEDPERSGLDSLLNAGGRIMTGVIIVVLGGSWAFGRGALERHVSAFETTPPAIKIEWPYVESADGETQLTWVPAPVQKDLERMISHELTPSPFDQGALVRAAERLQSTGWFADLGAVRREAGGRVRVTGEWRVPAAVVKKDGRSHLVATDGAILRMPEGTEPPERLYVIANPSTPAPLSDTGAIACGVPWKGEDVQASLALLKLLTGRGQVARQVAGIDLGEFGRSAKLVIVTDRGHRIVWGSPVGETLPGEVHVERKIARLEQNIRDFGRIDADQQRVEIYTPVVLVDKTAIPGGE